MDEHILPAESSKSHGALPPPSIRERSDTIRSIILGRRSVRRFSDAPVTQEDLRDLVQAGVYAPSGSNAQNQRFLVITDPAEIAAVGRARYIWPYRNCGPSTKDRNPAGIIGHARALIVVFVDAQLTDTRSLGEYHIWETLEIQNAAASIENILLLATAKGLASCWISASEGMSRTRLLTGRSWRKVLAPYDIPQSYKIQGMVLLGWPRTFDAAGFPVGEKRHGVPFQEVARKSAEHYLVRRRVADGTTDTRLSLWARLRLRTYAAVLGALQSLIRRIDLAIDKIERP